MTSKPITDRLTTLGQYAMNARPDLGPPDDVDVIQQQEAYEATIDYLSDAIEWGLGDADIVATIRDRFAMTDAYERGFRVWLDRQIP